MKKVYKKIIKLRFKIYNKFFPNLITSELYINYLKNTGVHIGEGTVIFNPSSVTIDNSRPLLVHIGKYCKITQGVIVLGHDYSRSVLRRVYGEVIGEAKKTFIGNNVFIGINSIVLMGTEIGDNCIIGAGSVCTGNYPSNSVIAGNPAKVILSLDDYYKKRINSYVSEAKTYAKYFYEVHKVKPTIQDMGAFFPLYLERNKDSLKQNNINTQLSGDNENEIINFFLNSKPVYRNYEDFLNNVFK